MITRLLATLLILLNTAAYADTRQPSTGSGGGGGGSSTITPAFYTSPGAISTADTMSIITATSSGAYTLAAGTNGIRHVIHNASTYTQTLTLSSFDGIANYVFTMAPGANIPVFYYTTNTTYYFN